MSSLHNRIKSVRIEAGLSQSDLAEKIGVSQPTVANWENGSHIPRSKAMERISSALNVDTIWLLSGEHSAANSPALDYLNAPIRHIPIYEWPNTIDSFASNKPKGYLPGATQKNALFALISDGTYAPKNALLLFDPDFTDLKPDDLCLEDTDNGPHFGKVKDSLERGKITARLTITLIHH